MAYSAFDATSWFNPSGNVLYDAYAPTNPYPSIIPQSFQQPAQPESAAWQLDPKLAEAANFSITEGKNTLAQLPGTAQIFQQGAAAADPFASQRPQYQNALANLMSGNFTPNDPSYKFRVEQGQQALERSAAAKGLLGSGNVLQALQKYGQDMGSQEFQNQFARLLPLTGATTGSPGSAGNILAGQYQAQRNAQADIGAGLAAQAAPPVVTPTPAPTPAPVPEKKPVKTYGYSNPYGGGTPIYGGGGSSSLRWA